MYRFFTDKEHVNLSERRILITGDDRNHIKNVLRIRENEEISVVVPGEEREYRCSICGFTEEAVELEIRFVKESDAELPCEVVLYQALPKSDKMEFVITKAVELGVSRIVPVSTSRAVVKLDDERGAKKTARWNAISEAAAKQSKRGTIPEVAKIMTMTEALSDCRDFDVKLIPYELADHQTMDTTREAVGGIGPGMKVAVFIGPEGGFTDKEIKEAEREGFLPITLGRRILRTETASLVVLSWIIYNTE